MKKIRLLIIVFLLSFVLNACDLIGKKSLDENVVLTLANGSLQLTMQANEIEGLKATVAHQANQTQECPACATAAPCEATGTPVSCPTCPAPVPTPITPPTATLKSGSASLSGTLNYPSEHIPPQRVVAFEVNTGYYYWVRTNEGQSSYRIDNLPAGTYVVVSYLEGQTFKAGYTVFVTCGHTCVPDHTLLRVELKDGEHKTDISPIDWYAGDDASGWPAEPAN